MRKLLLIVVTICVVVSLTVAAEHVTVETEFPTVTPPVLVPGIPTLVTTPVLVPTPIPDAVEDEDIPEEVEPVPHRGPAPEVIGEPLLWVARNVDRWKGWSLTGYSWGGLTSDYNPWRFKLGIVNAEWEVSRKMAIDSGDWTEFAEWQRQIQREGVLGFSFTITF